MARSVYEILAHKELLVEGYLVDFKIRPRICPKGYKVDYFGAFDLIAIKDGEPVRWISIKGHAGIPSAHMRVLQSIPLPPGNVKEVWAMNDNHVWRKLIVD